MLIRRGELPRTVGCIVMRNYDQVFKYHIQPMLRIWPELEDGYNKGDKTLRLPMGDGSYSQIDFSYGENLAEIERRFRSANYYDIFVDQAEQFVEEELREMKKACRWPGVGAGACKMLLSFNMGGAGIQTLRKWFHAKEYNEREDPGNFEFLHVFPWDNVEWSRPALEQDGLTESDYYSWTDVERMRYCATRSDYGKDLDSQDDALRNRDWLGSWESLEGAYFGRVFDRNSVLVTQRQVGQLVKYWDRRWIAQDWGKSHFCATYWNARVLISPSEAQSILGWEVERPINAVVTFRELVVNEMSSADVGKAIVAATPEAERKHTREFFLSPDAFGDRDSGNTVALSLGGELRAAGLPEPIQADNERIGGWQLMYDLLADTKRHGSVDGDVWLISAECPQLLNALPLAMRDPKNLDDVLKTDKGHARIEQDVLDAARYSLKSMLQPKATAPRDVRAQQVFESHESMTAKAMAMLKFNYEEKRRPKGGIVRRMRIR